MKIRTILLLAAALSFSGCVSTADVDLSKVETGCGQTCSANYSSCTGRFSFTPLLQQSGCADAFRACAKSCPAR